MIMGTSEIPSYQPAPKYTIPENSRQGEAEARLRHIIWPCMILTKADGGARGGPCRLRIFSTAQLQQASSDDDEAASRGELTINSGRRVLGSATWLGTLFLLERGGIDKGEGGGSLAQPEGMEDGGRRRHRSGHVCAEPAGRVATGLQKT